LNNFEQALNELKGLFIYSFVFERNVVIEKDIVSQLKFSDIEYPINMENRIRKEIRNGDYQKATEVGQQFKRIIIDSNGSPEHIREYTARFSSSIYNIAKEYSSELDTQYIFHYFVNNIIESKSKKSLIQNYEKILSVVLDKNDNQVETDNKIVMKVINYIRENYNKNITLSETAELVGLTPEYLSKLFYQEINTNFVVFIKNFRISIAKRMILSGKYRIHEIAEHVGIKDPKYFNKVFKSVCGVTPSEYKKVI
jgi:two-component system response regulator YesN